MYFFKKVLVFVEISLESTLVYWELFNYLKDYFLDVQVILISDQSEIFRFYKFINFDLDYYLFYLIVEKSRIDSKLKLFKNFFKKKSFEFNLTSNKNNGEKGNLITIYKRRIGKSEHDVKNLHVEIIETLKYFRNYMFGSFNFLEKLKNNQLTFKKSQEKIWIKSIIIWYLCLMNKSSFKVCCTRIKYLSDKLLEKKLDEKGYQNNLIFLKELPLYFLYHSVIIDSFFITPSILMKFELWKNNGLSKLLRFFGKICIFTKEIENFWLDINEKKRMYIIDCFESKTQYKLAYIFKRLFKDRKETIQTSSLDLALALRSVFDLKLKNLAKSKKKKNFWFAIESLFRAKNLKKFIEKNKKVQKFISQVGRIILAKKMFLSRKNTRLIYLTGSESISFEMVVGLLNFLISVFNKNKLTSKFLFIIIKEKETLFVFISHQSNNIFFFFQKFLHIFKYPEELNLIETRENLIVVKFSKIYEKIVLRALLKAAV